MATIIIYHANCSDGNAAAWVGKRRFPDALLHPANHGDPAPDVSGADVYVLDFSYKRPIMQKLQQEAKSFFVIDHHEKAWPNIVGFDCYFDLGRSGAGLAWDYFFPQESRPFFIDYIEDRDLWRWALPYSEEVNAGLARLPKNLSSLDALFLLDPNKAIENLKEAGTPVVEFRRSTIEAIANQSYEVEFEGHRVLVANTSILQSEVGAYLCKNRPYSVTWFKNAQGLYVYSLRSKGFDVGEIALKYGGGGHASSAGFRLNYLLF